jgi:hypothetical protein
MERLPPFLCAFAEITENQEPVKNHVPWANHLRRSACRYIIDPSLGVPNFISLEQSDNQGARGCGDWTDQVLLSVAFLGGNRDIAPNLYCKPCLKVVNG